MKHGSAAAMAGGSRRPRRLTPGSPHRVPGAAARPPVVIVADPDPTARAAIAALLRDDDLLVIEAGNVHAIERASSSSHPDLAVVDADLPGASRLRSRALSRDVPVVVVTRTPGPFADAVSIALDAVGVLAKPVDEDDLRTIVWNLAVPR